MIYLKTMKDQIIAEYDDAVAIWSNQVANTLNILETILRDVYGQDYASNVEAIKIFKNFYEMIKRAESVFSSTRSGFEDKQMRSLLREFIETDKRVKDTIIAYVRRDLNENVLGKSFVGHDDYLMFVYLVLRLYDWSILDHVDLSTVMGVSDELTGRPSLERIVEFIGYDWSKQGFMNMLDNTVHGFLGEVLHDNPVGDKEKPDAYVARVRKIVESTPAYMKQWEVSLDDFISASLNDLDGEDVKMLSDHIVKGFLGVFDEYGAHLPEVIREEIKLAKMREEAGK